MWGYAAGRGNLADSVDLQPQPGRKDDSGPDDANGVISIVGGFVTAWSLGWVLTTPGVLSYVGWNILVLALSIFVILALRKRQALAASPDQREWDVNTQKAVVHTLMDMASAVMFLNAAY